MAHNIFGNRFYGHRDKAWHELGLVTEEDMTAVEVLGKLGGYSFEKRPLHVELNGILAETKDYAIVRTPTHDDPTERVFGYTTKWYNIIQPQRVCEIFDTSVKQPVETLGMLGKGERLFLTWRLPEFDVKGDKIDVYGFLGCGYDAKYGASLNVVTTRVVCENTWAIADNEARNNKIDGRGRVWAGHHNSKNIERDLGIWMEHIQQQAEEKASITHGLFNTMAETPITKDSVYNLLFQIYPNPQPIPVNYPEKLRGEKQAKIDDEQKKAEKDRDLVMELFNGAGTAIDATAWGLFNACTEYENWGRMTKKAPEYSILFGNRANAMNQAFAVINNWMGQNDNE